MLRGKAKNRSLNNLPIVSLHNPYVVIVDSA